MVEAGHTATAPVMPLAVAIEFAHASVQVIARRHAIDVLHIKGAAMDSSLLSLEAGQPPATDAPWELRSSIDADVLVRPSDASRLIAALEEHNWSVRFHFRDGSTFRHAATLVHPMLAPVDLHRSFPGLGLPAAAAFDALWADREHKAIAGIDCAVPSLIAQRLILIVHAARSRALRSDDITRGWGTASPEQRDQLRALARELDAEVALAAGTGNLGHFRDRREHRLWYLLSTGAGSRVDLWWAWVRAQPSWQGRIAVGARLIVPPPGRLRGTLGRRPTTSEYAATALRRPAAALRDLRNRPRRRRANSRSPR